MKKRVADTLFRAVLILGVLGLMPAAASTGAVAKETGAVAKEQGSSKGGQVEPVASPAATQPLVTVGWLKGSLGGEDLVVLDIRNKIDGGSEKVFRAGHIPGAVYSNYLRDGWRTTVDGVIGKLPPVGRLEQLIGGLGIGNDSHVVVVAAGTSSTDFGSAARVYWTIKLLGHDKVSILEGGYKAWTADHANPVETGPAEVEPDIFVADFRPELLADSAEVQKVVAAGGKLLVDARPAKQYRGAEKHKQSRAAGTIPSAVNLPQSLVVPGQGDRPLTGERLAALLGRSGIDAKEDKVVFCNTGHWAATVWFALSELAGQQNVKLYDGSMVEWTKNPDRPLQASVASR